MSLTVYEFAIVRIVGQLRQAADERPLSQGEARLLRELASAVERIEAREAGAAESPAKSNRRRANGC
jgi:hypothetical protein